MNDHFRHPKFVVLLFSCAVLIIFGCSQDLSLTTSGNNNSPEYYFPLKSGSNIGYVVTNHRTGTVSHVDYVVGQPLTVDGMRAFPWMYYGSAGDTGFFYLSGDCLYYYSSDAANPEKILEAPFTVGRSWQRFVPATTTNVTYGNILDILLGGNGQKPYDDGGGEMQNDSTGNDGFGAFKNFPTVGSNYFTLAAVENVTLSDGNTYRNCLRVENQSSLGTNRYWYAPEVGLVRYAVNIVSPTYPGGQIIGEIASKRPF